MSSQTSHNEDIIAEITKDLAENLNTNNSDKDEQSKYYEVETNNQESSINNIPEEFEQSDSEETNKESEVDDCIDEEKLKDLEVELSDEEKAVRHKKALDLKNQGNEEFKNQKYLESISLYSDGLRICPLKFESDRAVLYSNRAASKAKLGRNKSAIEDCSKAIELNDKYIKAYLRRAKLYEETDKLDESLEDYKKILELDSSNREAVSAQIRLPPIINERNEKLKEEMLGKLKDLGNVILRPFGLSTNNFNLVQDPKTGGYSVNFSQNT